MISKIFWEAWSLTVYGHVEDLSHANELLQAVDDENFWLVDISRDFSRITLGLLVHF